MNYCTRCQPPDYKVECALVEGDWYTCPTCGGHGWTPTGDDTAWFFKPHDSRYGRDTARIAALTPEPDGMWRVTLFDPRGPVYHTVDKAETIMHSVSGYKYSPSAGKLLDHWSKQDTWRQGVDMLTWIAYVNLLTFVGKSDELYEIWSLPLDEKLAAARRLKQAHAPNDELW